MIKQYFKHRKVCKRLGIKPFGFIEYMSEKNRETHFLYKEGEFRSKRGNRVTKYKFLRWD